MTKIIGIDALKGIAIISVILLHSFGKNTLERIGAPFHIWQAVPVFLLLAGLNSTGAYQRRSLEKTRDFFKLRNLGPNLKRILTPFAIAWALQCVWLFYKGDFDIGTAIELTWSGKGGRGNYFIAIIIQHILFFPFIYLTISKAKNRLSALAFVFAVNAVLELLMVWLHVPSEIYRILYVRYIGAAALGCFIASEHFSTKVLYPLAAVSGAYIALINYFNYQFSFIPDLWRHQHYPSFFFTLMLCLPFIRSTNPRLAPLAFLGPASYHIFLTQMVWFWIRPSENFLVNLLVCIPIGLLFFKLTTPNLHKSHR